MQEMTEHAAHALQLRERRDKFVQKALVDVTSIFAACPDEEFKNGFEVMFADEIEKQIFRKMNERATQVESVRDRVGAATSSLSQEMMLLNNEADLRSKVMVTLNAEHLAIGHNRVPYEDISCVYAPDEYCLVILRNADQRKITLMTRDRRTRDVWRSHLEKRSKTQSPNIDEECTYEDICI